MQRIHRQNRICQYACARKSTLLPNLVYCCLFVTSILVILGLSVCLQARTIVDMTGRKVEVPEKITRVSTNYRIATDMIFALGKQDMLVGVATRPSQIMKLLYPEISRAKTANKNSGIEELLVMRPDLIFFQPCPMVERLEQMGIPVICLKGETPDDMLKGLNMMASVLGCEARARDLSEYVHDKLDYIRSRTASAGQKKVYMTGTSALLTTVGGDFYQDHIIRAAGGINVAHALNGGWVGVSREHLIAWNPDMIIIPPYGSVTRDHILEDEGLQMITAVKNRAVYVFPAYLDAWDLPTPESIMGVMWLANILYPEKICFDMENQAHTFYTRFYGGYPVAIDLTGNMP